MSVQVPVECRSYSSSSYQDTNNGRKGNIGPHSPHWRLRPLVDFAEIVAEGCGSIPSKCIAHTR